MSNLHKILVLCCCVFALASCSSNDEDTTAEYYNWRARNDTYFEEIYQKATEEIDNGSEDWYKIMSYQKNDVSNHSNYIIVHVLEQDESIDGHKEVIDDNKNTNDGLACPLSVDSCLITYRGNMMPSSKHTTIAKPDNIEVGYMFDTKWYGEELNKEEAVFTNLTPAGSVEGFETVLLYMHPGDRWRVYIPYRLGYKASSSGSIQPYSTLIFDIYLKSFKTKQK